jgi:hypothetical protein
VTNDEMKLRNLENMFAANAANKRMGQSRLDYVIAIFLSCPLVDVVITIFGEFRQFSASFANFPQFSQLFGNFRNFSASFANFRRKY